MLNNQAPNQPQTPLLAVDAIIEHKGGIVLIERKNEPFGWALPGGFVDANLESADDAIIREVREETNLDVISSEQFKLYSKPNRDPRGHIASMVYIIKATGELMAKDDAKKCEIVQTEELYKYNFAFDHKQIIEDYMKKINLM
ncbi:MAG: NUDIX domain-containing protein [Candidatus Nanoarchaeia archaeon]